MEKRHTLSECCCRNEMKKNCVGIGGGGEGTSCNNSTHATEKSSLRIYMHTRALAHKWQRMGREWFGKHSSERREQFRRMGSSSDRIFIGWGWGRGGETTRALTYTFKEQISELQGVGGFGGGQREAGRRIVEGRGRWITVRGETGAKGHSGGHMWATTSISTYIYPFRVVLLFFFTCTA